MSPGWTWKHSDLDRWCPKIFPEKAWPHIGARVALPMLHGHHSFWALASTAIIVLTCLLSHVFRLPVLRQCFVCHMLIIHVIHETEGPWPSNTLQAPSLVEKAELVHVRFTLCYAWGTNGVCECTMRCKVYMDSYVASNGSCFMVTWTILKNHLLEVSLT